MPRSGPGPMEEDKKPCSEVRWCRVVHSVRLAQDWPNANLTRRSSGWVCSALHPIHGVYQETRSLSLVGIFLFSRNSVTPREVSSLVQYVVRILNTKILMLSPNNMKSLNNISPSLNNLYKRCYKYVEVKVTNEASFGIRRPYFSHFYT